MKSVTVRQTYAIDPIRAGYSLELHAWQREALEAWHVAGRRGIIEAVTGSGKTRIGEAAIAEHLREARARAVILVPTIDLANQWIRRLHIVFSVPVAIVGDGSIADLSTNSILVFVARTATDELPAQMRRLAAIRPVLVVADECHRYGTELYARALDATFAATLGLSATPQREADQGMEQFVIPRLGPIVYTYGHERGIGEAVISVFRVCFVGVDFAAPERLEHDTLCKRIERQHRTLLREFPFLRGARPFIEAVKRLALHDEEGVARGFLSVTGERRRLLNGARARSDVVFSSPSTEHSTTFVRFCFTKQLPTASIWLRA